MKNQILDNNKFKEYQKEIKKVDVKNRLTDVNI